ncbi:MAG: hypothetical protein JNK72_14075 [Myxococcales bacterium]|nr:hypothetical protein [Myxococcales bacterium]
MKRARCGRRAWAALPLMLTSRALAQPVISAPAEAPVAVTVTARPAAPRARLHPAHIDSPDPFIEQPAALFLERNRIFQSLPHPGRPGARPTLLFEAEVAPHFFLHEGLSGALRSTPMGRWGWAFAGSLTVVTRLRMVDPERSSPVRMPSFMPRAQLQVFFFQMPNLRGPAPRYWLVSPSFALAHHSNGQDGCTFDSARRDDALCQMNIPARDLAAQLNRQSGDFSTNYLWATLHAQRGWVNPHSGAVARSVTASVELELHPLSMGPGGISVETARRYGQTRLRFGAEYLEEFGTLRGRAQLGVERAFGAHPEVRPYRVWAEVAITSHRWHGFGGFARVHLGQDYYNAFYVDQLNTLQLGVLWDLSPRLRFHDPGGELPSEG